MTSITAKLRGLWLRVKRSRNSASALPMLDEIRQLADELQPTWGPGLRQLRSEGIPLNAGAPDDDNSDDDSDDDDNGGSDDDDDSSDDDDQDDDDSDDDSDDDDDQDDEPLTDKERKEYHRLRREASERAKREKAARKKQAEESGKWKTLHEETEKERDDAINERDEIKAELAAFKRTIKVSKVAKRLKFNDPDDAHHFLPENAADGTEAEIEKALRDVLKKKSYLANRGSTRKGKPAGGDDDDNPARGSDIGDLDDPKAIREAEEKLRK